MPSGNTITILGHLGRDPERREYDGGSVVSFSVAVSYYAKPENKTAWFNVSVWGAVGDRAMQYLKKGSLVFLSGELRPREYEKDGKTRTSLDVNCYSWTFASAKPEQQEKHEAQPTQEEDDLPF
jgi:single-strand DNA-binding protein